MINIKNGLCGSLQTLLSRISALHSSQRFSDFTLRRIRREIGQRINYSGSLSLVDLTSRFHLFKLPEFPRALEYRVASFAEFINHVATGVAAWTFTQGYESFEAYLKDTVAHLLLYNQALASPVEFAKYATQKGPLRVDIHYWREYIDFAQSLRGNKKLLTFVRLHAPGICIVEKTNYHRVDLAEWFKYITEVRHALTHSNGVLKASKLQSLNFAKCQSWIPLKVLSTKDYYIEVTPEHSEKTLAHLGEYAYLIYCKVAHACRLSPVALPDVLARTGASRQ